MDDLIAFLAARLGEDEALAKRGEEVFATGWPDYQTFDSPELDDACKYLDRFGPARVLREVEAGRRILARYQDCLARMEDPDYPHAVARDQAREYEDFVLPNLLTRWAGHRDYRQEWRP